MLNQTDLRQAFDDHKHAVYDFALRMTGTPSTAEDISQDTFLELLRKPQSFDPARGTLRVFLIGVARNLVYRRWRTEQRFIPTDDLDDTPAILPDPNASTIAETIRNAVQSLPPLQREAVLLFEYEGFTLEEIAAIANVETGTVKSRLHRARTSLRLALAPLQNGVQPCLNKL
ncbi:MAG: RNA polymerase sigma factor [Bryobacteraceae bacterium]